MNAIRLCISVTAGTILAAAVRAAATDGAEASAPKGTTVSVYDSGFALVSELRSVTLARGANTVRLTGLPARLDPATVSFSVLGGVAGLRVEQQQFEHDTADLAGMLKRYQGRAVSVSTSGNKWKGILLGEVEGDAGVGDGLSLRADDGTAILVPGRDRIVDAQFPQADRYAFLQPTLLWRVSAAQEGPRNLRLSYAVPGLWWSAAYEAILAPDERTAYLTVRAGIRNETGGSFHDARVRLVATERGSVPLPGAGPGTVEAPESPVLRYEYGGAEPTFERAAASAGALTTYDLPVSLDLGPSEVRHVHLLTADKLPVNRFYVYDGVRFDRFQRNRRNDWNYGTEFHRVVETHFEFNNKVEEGLGVELPPGRFRVYRTRPDESLDLIGEDDVLAIAPQSTAHVLVGPARGLTGERERTGYSEIVPLHVYEESFEIRLRNDIQDEVEIRVIEHLYRWDVFEVVKADTDYKVVAPQTVEFRPVLKPGGVRSVHYTVRYTW